MLRLKKRAEFITVSPAEMNDGEIGEIISWTSGLQQEGKIVQAHQDRLVVLGECSGDSYSSRNTITEKDFPQCKVRILEWGDELIYQK